MRRIVAALVLALLVPSAASAGRIIQIGWDENGKTTRLHIGNVIAVSVPGEQDTGYRWIVDAVDYRVLGVGLFGFQAGSSDPTAYGTYTIGLRAEAVGRTKLRLAYVPLGHRDGAVSIFTLNVIVTRA